MSQPIVSVVIPAKDQEHFVYDSLHSLRNQGIAQGDLEVIVVNDGSTDDTAGVAQEFSSSFGSFQLITHPMNLGVSAARNTGIAASCGQSIAFLDPDDWFGPNFLSNCVEAMNALDLDFVRTDHTRQTGGTREVWRAPELRRNQALHPLDGAIVSNATTMLDYPYPPTGIFSARLRDSGLLRFNEQCATAEDRELMWRVHLNSTKYAVISEPGFFYRRNVAGSLTAAFTSRQLGYFVAFDSVFSQINAANPSASFSQEALREKAVHQFLAITHFHLDRIQRVTSSIPAAKKTTLGEEEQAKAREALTFEFDLRRAFISFVTRNPQVESRIDKLGEKRATILRAALLDDALLGV